jgi:cytochrome P450
MLSKRQALGATRKDILPNSLASDVETGARFTQEHLSANAITLVVAGSVTASTALTQIFRMLALNNEIVAKIQKEVNAVEILNVEKTRNLRNLNGAVKEGLRLLNALPSGIQATTSLLEWKLRDLYTRKCAGRGSALDYYE